MYKRALSLATQFKIAVDQILPPATDRAERLGKLHLEPLHQFDDDAFGMSSKTKRERSKTELDALQHTLVSQTTDSDEDAPAPMIHDVQDFLSKVNSDNIMPICKKALDSEVLFAQPIVAFKGLLAKALEMFGRGNREVIPCLTALKKRIKQIESVDYM